MEFCRARWDNGLSRMDVDCLVDGKENAIDGDHDGVVLVGVHPSILVGVGVLGVVIVIVIVVVIFSIGCGDHDGVVVAVVVVHHEANQVEKQE